MGSAKQTLTLSGPHESQEAPTSLRTCILHCMFGLGAPKPSKTRGPLDTQLGSPRAAATPPFMSNLVLDSFRSRPGPSSNTFFRLRRPPRAFQEPIKTPSAAITHLRCNLKQFYIDFDLQKETPGPQKSFKSFVLCSSCVVFSISARIASWARFWTLLASFLGAF